MKQLSFYILALLFIPGLHTFGQVSINTDNTPPHPSSMLDVKATDKGVLITRMTEAQRLAIGTPTPGLFLYQTNGMKGFYYYNGASWERIGVNTGHYVGKAWGGGIICYVDESGMSGLIVSCVDLSTSQAWSNVTDALIGDSAQSVWNGLVNSTAIVNQVQHTNSAAQLCLDYFNVDYGDGIFYDWFLSSPGQIRHLRNNIYQVQRTLELDGDSETTPISDGTYWTSRETNADSARVCGLIDEGQFQDTGKSAPLNVRAVRVF